MTIMKEEWSRGGSKMGGWVVEERRREGYRRGGKVAIRTIETRTEGLRKRKGKCLTL